MVVGAAVDDDEVLGCGIGDHLRAAGRDPGNSGQAGVVDVFAAKVFAIGAALGVVADGADQRDMRALTGGGDGLVGALAAELALGGGSDDGVAGARQIPHLPDEIDIQRADHHDAGGNGAG